jgi:hypothetical protein
MKSASDERDGLSESESALLTHASLADRLDTGHGASDVFRVTRPLLVVFLALLACNSSTRKPADDPNAGRAPGPGAKAPIQSSEYTPPPARTAPDESSNDAPEISRSAGAAGGVVVLWPRLVLPHGAGKPDDETLALARKAQARLANLARSTLSGANVDVRPEPERVCPKNGCAGVSLGLLFARAGNGCSLFALVSGPGKSPSRLVPWSPGAVKLSAPSVGFREPPERVVKVDDYASCGKLPDDLAPKDGEVAAAIKSAAGR